MNVLGRILIAVDFSPSADAAVAYGFDLAERVGASVEVLHVWTTPEYVAPDVAVQIATGRGPMTLRMLAETDSKTRMSALLERIDRPEGVDVRATVVLGDPVEVVVRRAHNADLVIVGTHGRHGVDRLFMGSVAERIVRMCTPPVLTVHAADTSKTPQKRWQQPPRRILAAVDLSPCSVRAYAYAEKLAKQLGAELDVLHVVSSVPSVEGSEIFVIALSGDRPEPYLAWAKTRAAAELASMLPDLRSAPLIEMGDPASTIGAIATADYDLVVLGTHGRTGLARFTLGSVAERVLRRSPFPVVTVREPPSHAGPR